jgi:cytochrome c biogenesis protein CcdA
MTKSTTPVEAEKAKDKPNGTDKGSRSFVNIMMFAIAFPMVFSYILMSIYLIWQGFHDPYVVENIDAYKSVLQILAGPSLVIVYKVLEIWTSQHNQRFDLERSKVNK